MQSNPSYSAWQFTGFRILFGLYLIWHFATLMPYGAELFSNQGLLADSALNPTSGLFPNPLAFWDSPTVVTIFLGLAVLAAFLFTIGVARPWMGVLLWFLSTALFHRNNLTSNPALPYLGLILLLSSLVPAGEPLSFRKSTRTWAMPKWIPLVATVLLALGYTFSGWTKLASPSWLDGSALHHILQNPLARPSGVRDLLLDLPAQVLLIATWAALAAELLYLPLTLIRRTRPWIWLALLLMHLSLIVLIDFADLSLGMLMIHLFTFDPKWLPARKPARARNHVRLLFDDQCLMCNRFLDFLAREDKATLLRFEPLPADHPRLSMLVIRDEKTYQRSDAVLVLLDSLGGHWRALTFAGRLLPRPLRDFAYILVARNRHRFGRTTSCALPSAHVRSRLRPPSEPTPNSPKRRAPQFTTTALTLLLVVTLFNVIGCTSAPLHTGRYPFSMMERPPGGNHLKRNTAAFREVLRYQPGDDLSKATRKLKIGDVVAFHMSHREATAHLRQGTIQKIPYELFSFGHLALVVPPPEAQPRDLRLFQLSMSEAANVDQGFDFLENQSWVLYRPTSNLDHDRLNEFVSVALKRASVPKEAYDFTGVFGIHNRSTTPDQPSEIASEYTCATLIQAALHYSGHPTRGVHRGGILDIVTPGQVIRAGKRSSN